MVLTGNPMEVLVLMSRYILVLISMLMLSGHASAQPEVGAPGTMYPTAIVPWPGTPTPSIDPSFTVNGVPLGTIQTQAAAGGASGTSVLVQSVAGRTGAVVLSVGDVSGLGSIATQSAGAVAIAGGSIAGADLSGSNVTITPPLGGSIIDTFANWIGRQYYNTGTYGDTIYTESAIVTVNTGSHNYTITGLTFTSSDIGKLITVGAAGGGGSPTSGTITAVSGSVVTTSVASNTTLAAVTTYVVYGHNDTSALQTLLPTGGGEVIIYPGNYLIAGPGLTVYSNTAIKCRPGATFYMINGWNALASHFIFSNAHPTSEGGDTNITIDGCGFNGSTTLASTGAHAARFTYAANITIRNSRFDNFGDATACVACSGSLVEHNIATNITNTCWDHWYAPQNITTIGNYCETRKHGVQITGTDSGTKQATLAAHVSVINETIVQLTTAGAAVWFNGMGPPGAGVTDGYIIGGHFSCPVCATTTTGIKISGVSSNIWIIGTHTINGSLYLGAGGDTSGNPSDVHVIGVSLEGLNAPGLPAVAIWCVHCGISNSHIDGIYRYGVQLNSAQSYAVNNDITAGTAARVMDSNGNNTFVMAPDFDTGVMNLQAGLQLGVLGSTGKPVTGVGALIDGSGVRQSLGSTYTVPVNTSLVRFVQSSTVPTSTITLPIAIADGQPIQLVNYAGEVTALTFSPTVNGWTNGSALAAFTGLRVRWDATLAGWYREQ